MRKTGQRLVAHSRTEPLTKQEMKHLGRLVSAELPLEHVRFPCREPTVAVDLVGYTGPIPSRVAAQIRRVIGDFESAGLSPPDRPGVRTPGLTIGDLRLGWASDRLGRAPRPPLKVGGSSMIAGEPGTT